MILLLLAQAVEQLARPTPPSRAVETEQVATTAPDVTVMQLPDTPRRVVQPEPEPTDGRDRRSSVGEERLIVTILGQPNAAQADPALRDLGVEAIVGTAALPALRTLPTGNVPGKKP